MDSAHIRAFLFNGIHIEVLSNNKVAVYFKRIGNSIESGWPINDLIAVDVLDMKLAASVLAAD